jgi:hypothetical protein
VALATGGGLEIVGDPPISVTHDHCSTSENVDPRFTARAGILVTTAGPDWDELCNQLAKTKK